MLATCDGRSCVCVCVRGFLAKKRNEEEQEGPPGLGTKASARCEWSRYQTHETQYRRCIDLVGGDKNVLMVSCIIELTRILFVTCVL